MQKAVLKVYIEHRIRPLFVADIYDEIDKTIDEFLKEINNENNFTIKFGQIVFKRSLFHHYEVKYK